MKALNTVTLVIAKILEILSWIAAAVLLAGLIALIAIGPDRLTLLAEAILADPAEAAALGLASEVAAVGPAQVRALLLQYAALGVIVAPLAAMIFRNVYLIIRTSKGRTWFARGATPFQPDVIRMLREIGIFAIAIPAAEILFTIVVRIFFRPDIVETSVDLFGLLMGLLVLWLTQVFTYGASLEQDAEGLI